MARVLIADDHAVVRKGLAQILADAPDMEVLGEAAEAAGLFELLKEQAWDIIVLDLSMPGKSGMETLKDLNGMYPHIPVLVLSIHPEEQYALRVLKAGAAGYITKQSAPDELVHAIRKVLSGGRYISPAAAEKLAFSLVAGADKPAPAALSDRELEVLCKIAGGLTVSEIADRLCLSPKTVSTYRARVLEKLDLKTTADLVRYCLENGLAD